VVVGVRLTVGLYGTKVDRPYSPAVLIYTRSEIIFILCGAAFFAAWVANGAGFFNKNFALIKKSL
jgi:hypothetical protein